MKEKYDRNVNPRQSRVTHKVYATAEGLDDVIRETRPHVLLTVVDAANATQRLNAALLRREVNARLDALPMLRQSLVEVPFNIDRPWWRDHPGFDLNYHLRHIAVPDPDDPNSLADLAI